MDTDINIIITAVEHANSKAKDINLVAGRSIVNNGYLVISEEYWVSENK